MSIVKKSIDFVIQNVIKLCLSFFPIPAFASDFLVKYSLNILDSYYLDNNQTDNESIDLLGNDVPDS